MVVTKRVVKERTGSDEQGMASFYVLLAMHVYSLYDEYWVLMMYAFHPVNNTFDKKFKVFLKIIPL